MRSTLKTSVGLIGYEDNINWGFPPVLFLHGNSTCLSVFEKQQSHPSLTSRYRLISANLPGHGYSSYVKHAATTYTFEGYASAIIELIETLKLKNLTIVGWSLGGHVGLSILEMGYRLKGLVIVSTPPFDTCENEFLLAFHPSPRQLELYAKEYLSAEEMHELLQPSGFDVDKNHPLIKSAMRTDGRARKCLSESLLSGRGPAQRTFVETRQDPTPLCVIVGEHDSLINMSYLQEIKFRNLYGGQIFVVPAAEHAVMWHKADEFNTILEDFLGEIHSYGVEEANTHP